MIDFPIFTGTRCLMMPYIQGDPSSVPEQYGTYFGIIESTFLQRGQIGFLTIDEKPGKKGEPHRGKRARFGRALHTEAGLHGAVYAWGSPYGWGMSHNVELERDTRILIGSSLSDTCAVWDAEHEDTSLDGDIGHEAHMYPMDEAHVLKAGEVAEIGILTPHESLPLKTDGNRQFLRIVGSGVHGREPYFTQNPLVPHD